jgi:hypothetical protein
MASRLGATINKILDLCRAHSQGLPQKVLDEELQEVEVEIIKQSLNFLLQKQKLQVFMQGESIVYREQDTEAAAKFKGLTSEDMLVYQAIQWAENTGHYVLQGIPIFNSRDICMVLHECQPDIVISRQSCLYFKDWGTGSFCHLSLSGPHPQESSFKPRNVDSLERRNSTSIKS